MIVVNQDPLIAEEFNDLVVWLASIRRPTSALKKLNVQLASILCIKVARDHHGFFVEAEEFLLVLSRVVIGDLMTFEETRTTFALQVTQFCFESVVEAKLLCSANIAR